MTGFIALAGGFASISATDLLARHAVTDGLPLTSVYQSDDVHLFCTSDLPFIVEGDLVVVGDVLLDTPRSGLTSLQRQRFAGLRAIAEAYRATGGLPARFGREQHFVLWDSTRGLLVAGRDEFGVRPIYHHCRDKSFMVASAMRLLVAAGVAEEVDDESILRFVVNISPRVERTYLREVRRLGPGESVQWAHTSGPVIARAPARGVSQRYERCTAEAVQDFRALFFTAVSQRMGGADETLSLLSGGLDSSSISLVAARIAREEGAPAPRSFSVVFDETPQWSEREEIEAVIAAGDLTGHIFDIRAPDPFESFSLRLAEHGGLFFGPGAYLGRRLYEAAAAAGMSIVLDGHGGDEVVSHGPGRLHDLAINGCWRLLWSELKAGDQPGHPATPSVLFLFWLRYGPLKTIARKSVWIWKAIARRIVGRRSQKRFDLAAKSTRSLIEAAEPTGSIDGSAEDFETRRHRELVCDPTQSIAMETLYAAGSPLGVLPRFPFWDRSLVEFCLALPGDVKRRAGYGRWILREAISELPDATRWRRDKLDFSPHLARGLWAHHGLFFRDLVATPSSPIWRYVDRDRAGRLVAKLARLRERTPGGEAQSLWRIGALALWLNDLSERQGRGLGPGGPAQRLATTGQRGQPSA